MIVVNAVKSKICYSVHYHTLGRSKKCIGSAVHVAHETDRYKVRTVYVMHIHLFCGVLFGYMNGYSHINCQLNQSLVGA